MARQVNLKAVLLLLGGCAAASAAVHFAHEAQVGRNARALLGQAALAQEEGRPEAADEVIEAMVRADGRSLQGRLIAARYYLQAGAPDRAQAHARFALDE